MSGTVQSPINPSSELVSSAFVHQYYKILHETPNVLHRFYTNLSKLGRQEKDGVMNTITGSLQVIEERILSLRYGEYSTEIVTVDSQESHGGGVILLVGGYLLGKDGSRRKFTQCFFLAPQDNGYYVLNDIFRFVDEVDCLSSIESPEPADPPAHDSLTEEHNDIAHDKTQNVTDQRDAMTNKEQQVSEVSRIEEAARVSYASIVKVAKDNASMVPSAPKSSEQVAPKAQPTPPPGTLISVKSSESLNSHDNEVEGHSIYVKNLPLDATPEFLENEFRKFGAIRQNGVQVKCPKGFCFGFVEFESADSVRRALEASPMVINGFRVSVEEKRSTSRGNNRGRFPFVAGNGYRHDGARGRGNFAGGRAYNRSDYPRADYGNRSDYPRADYGNRGGGRGGYASYDGGVDGYRRGERMGYNGGGRPHRGNGTPTNGAGRNVTPRVSATA